MCLMLCKAGDKRLEAAVYIGEDSLCYYFLVLVCWELFFKMCLCTTHPKVLPLFSAFHFNLWFSSHVM